MVNYSPSLLEQVNRELDKDVIARLGYEFEERTLERRSVGDLTLTLRPRTNDAEVTASLTDDPYNLKEICRWSGAVANVVDVGAHVGAATLSAKRLWPECRVLAYEVCPENARVLRINARTETRIIVFQAAMTDGGGKTAGFRAATDENNTSGGRVDHCGALTVPAVGLNHAMKHHRGRIDVLKIGCEASVAGVMAGARKQGILGRVGWISGRLPLESSARNELKRSLAPTHCLETRTTAQGQFFLAWPRGAGIKTTTSRSASPKLTVSSANSAARRFVKSIGHYPSRQFRGRGIVICAGGARYFPCAWVCIKMLRRLRVRLPIEMWALNGGEIDPRIKELVEPLGVRCVDASGVRQRHPIRILDGWELKPYAILHSRFREVLLLDADNVPVANPVDLFESKAYQLHGSTFWPGLAPLRRSDRIWRICGVRYRRESDFETGQILIDKSRCWVELNLTMHMNEHSDFYYEHIYGDKETFHMAWRMLGREYAMIPTPAAVLDRVLCQHDWEGRRLFQHRYGAKWNLREPNELVPGFLLEDVCFDFLDELYDRWDGRIEPTVPSGIPVGRGADRVGARKTTFTSFCKHSESR